MMSVFMLLIPITAILMETPIVGECAAGARLLREGIHRLIGRVQSKMLTLKVSPHASMAMKSTGMQGEAHGEDTVVEVIKQTEEDTPRRTGGDVNDGTAGGGAETIPTISQEL